ncbi:MAG: 5'/3'-nucleotidase SurE [Treponema sp.]|jgi:5'-nucleotidase|nr:5'/3'-nucleotidase SurE [Treponema sp.]
MNILLTNDDGIDSPGLLLLAKALREKGKDRVLVLAPDRDRSGVSDAISFLKNPLRVHLRGPDTWSCSGTPADCVILSFLGALREKPDMVISGINRGANLGNDLVYSGTAAAARQAGIQGIPAIALSLAGRKEFFWNMAVSFFLARFDEFAGRWKEGTFVNINIPNTAEGPSGTGLAFPSKSLYDDRISDFSASNGDRWFFVDMGEGSSAGEAGSDRDRIAHNLASVSVIRAYPVNDDAAGGHG